LTVEAVARWWPGAFTGFVLLVVLPRSESAFLQPKGMMLVVGAGVGALLAAWLRRVVPWAFVPWLVVVCATTIWSGWEAPEGLTLVAGAVALVAWAWVGAPPDVSAKVLAVPLVVCSALAVGQAVGLDPFPTLGSEATGRLAIASTLGNPDFVGSALVAGGFLLLSHRRTALGLLLVVPALAATRSFATLAAVLAGAAFIALHRGSSRRGWLAVVVTIVVLALGLVGRDPALTVRGRRYLHRVAAPAVLDAGLFGGGPGFVELQWARWELDLWTFRCGDDAGCVAAHPDARFTGLQSHVHDDWLELLLEFGLVGLVTWLVAVGWVLRRAWVAPEPFAGAAIVALIVRATVDFPLHRAADLALFALAAAIACWRPPQPNLPVT
jgi:O-antigen ligase